MEKNLKNVMRLTVVARRFFVHQAKQQDWDTNLGGWCLLASRTLEAVLTRSGIPCVTVGTKDLSGHFWVEVGKYIIDITATQFGVLQPIVVLNKEEDDIHKRYTQKGNVIALGSALEAIHKKWHRFAVTDDIVEPYVLEILDWVKGIKYPTKVRPLFEIARERSKVLAAA